MFIKKTLKIDRSTGKEYSSYYLVESGRTEKGPRQRTLLYMGSEIALPEGEHKLLAQTYRRNYIRPAVVISLFRRC